MIDNLKKEVFEANQLLPKYNLVSYTVGTVSGIDRANKMIVMKPSEISFDRLTPEDLVVTDLSGKKVEGKYNPPADIATHIELYNAFEEVNAVANTMSRWATIFAQMSMSIPPLGKLHADYFHGEIPFTRKLKLYEIRGNYEKEMGAVIVERFMKGKLNPLEMPGILVSNHGPYTWSTSPREAANLAAVLEEIAFTAWHCMALPDKYLVPMQKDLMDRHFNRAHISNSGNKHEFSKESLLKMD